MWLWDVFKKCGGHIRKGFETQRCGQTSKHSKKKQIPYDKIYTGKRSTAKRCGESNVCTKQWHCPDVYGHTYIHERVSTENIHVYKSSVEASPSYGLFSIKSKKNSDSSGPSSGKSVQWTAFRHLSSPNWERIVWGNKI